MHDTLPQDDITLLDEAPGVNGNLEEDWVPVGDFLDNDQAFTDRHLLKQCARHSNARTS